MPTFANNNNNNTIDLSVMKDHSIAKSSSIMDPASAALSTVAMINGNSNNSNNSNCQPQSVATTVTISDDSSVSTLGSNASSLNQSSSSLSLSATRRSLFPKFWKKTGQSPVIVKQRTQVVPVIVEVADDTGNCHHHHQQQQQQQHPNQEQRQESSPMHSVSNDDIAAVDGGAAAAVRSPSTPDVHCNNNSSNNSRNRLQLSSSPRRSLFGASPMDRSSSFHHGTPASSLTYTLRDSCSRSKSDPSLQRRRSNKVTVVSCLRESRFSFHSTHSIREESTSTTTTTTTTTTAVATGTASPSKQDEQQQQKQHPLFVRKQRTLSVGSESCSVSVASSVVQFDMESTEIRHFVPPEEFHAEDGWANYFH